MSDCPLRSIAWEADGFGSIPMSERDLKRIEVLSEVLAGRRTVATGAAVLAISECQAYRLLIHGHVARLRSLA